LSQSGVYCYTVHEKFYMKDDDKGLLSETNSPHIQKDVIKLLSSSDCNRFADAIGKGKSDRKSE
jgi:hypothetical protein